MRLVYLAIPLLLDTYSHSNLSVLRIMLQWLSSGLQHHEKWVVSWKNYGHDKMSSKKNEMQMCVLIIVTMMGKNIYVNEDGEKWYELFLLGGSCSILFFYFPPVVLIWVYISGKKVKKKYVTHIQ